jgi:hypothetical protein
MRPEAVLFTARDKREFILLLDHRGIITAEKYADAGFGDLLIGLAQGRLGYLAALIMGALKVHQPELTIEDVWDLLEVEEKELGEALGKAVEQSRPAQMALAKIKQKVEGENPPTAGETDGTGTPSSSPGAKKVSRAKISSSKRQEATAQ